MKFTRRDFIRTGSIFGGGLIINSKIGANVFTKTTLPAEQITAVSTWAPTIQSTEK